MLCMPVPGIGAMVVLDAPCRMAPADPGPRLLPFSRAFMGVMVGIERAEIRFPEGARSHRQFAESAARP